MRMKHEPELKYLIKVFNTWKSEQFYRDNTTDLWYLLLCRYVHRANKEILGITMQYVYRNVEITI